ncbi:MAG: N-acetylmuramoyl-L-alanine amidase [Phycisphaerae bacterium]|nr:N-acetylmuramoyl-L-alanine amidase [Phycisphaerae bacterium]
MRTYVQMPAAFLGNMTELQCEHIIHDQVERLRRIEGLRGFAIYAKPIENPEAKYKPLPDYLPPPTGELDKPEIDASIAGHPSRAGGLPTYNPGQPTGALSGKTVFLSPGHGWYYSSALSRWATQRPNCFGIIEDHSNAEAVFNHLARYLHNAGANVWPCRERDFNANMVIVDNSDGAPDYTTSGTWADSTTSGNWYGVNYQYSPVSTTETAVATYAPGIPEAGHYAVYVWTPSSPNRPTDAMVRVNHTGGTTTHVINMQHDGNTWRFLGVYHFEAGRDAARGSVEISNQGSDPSKFVIADAVRFGGGMGDYVDGGSISGWPRWEESGRYFAVFMGQPGTPYGTVSAMPRYAKWENESWEDSIYISWHTNAGSGSGHGTQVYVYGPNDPPSPFGEFSGVAGSDTLATRIRDEMANDLRIGWNDPSWPANLYSAWFGELNPAYNDETPGVLVEVAYHDSETDANSILDPRFRDMVSRAIYQAIVKWWHNEADGPSSTPIPVETLLPEPPTHLSVCNLGNGDVRVSWHSPPSNIGDDLLGDPATGYLVQISQDGCGFDDGTATAGTSIGFAGLEPGSIHYFRVCATNAGGQSFPSEIGGVKARDDGTSPILVVNGFDRLDRGMMLVEDDPYDSDPMRRERLGLMNHYAYIRTFATAIDPSEIAFDFCANEAVRDGDVDLTPYQAVIWQSGEESSADHTFDDTEQSLLTAYLDGGGRLFVSGAEIGWDLDHLDNGRSFYNDYLKADYQADGAGTYDVTPVPGSIFDGISPFTFDDGASIYDVNYPDVLGTFGGSTAALTYSGGIGGDAGVVHDGSFKVVHFAFPFETITDGLCRTEIMAAVLDFFDLLIPDDIILESRDSEGVVTLPPAYNEVGTWANSSIKSAAPGLSGSGSRFITYEVPNSGTDNATFIPTIVTPGKYEVFVTWANGANCYDARHTVRHHQGQTALLIDQIPTGALEEPNFDEWISLGQHWFQVGQGVDNASVNISEETITGRPSETWHYRLYADAVKWVFVDRWPNGDYNDDSHIDLLDFAAFPGCLTGPGGGYAQPDCQAFDFDVDGDVDLDDFAGFQEAFDG